MPTGRTAPISQLTRKMPFHSEAHSPLFLPSSITPHTTDICQRGSRLIRPFSVHLSDSASHGAFDRSCWPLLGVPLRTNQSRKMQMVSLASFQIWVGALGHRPRSIIISRSSSDPSPIVTIPPFCPTAAAHGKGMVDMLIARFQPLHDRYSSIDPSTSTDRAFTE